MSEPAPRIVLGSRSPRRRGLLASLVPPESIVVLPPEDADEPGFDDCPNDAAIDRRLLEIVRAKSDDVVPRAPAGTAVLTADTVIVATGEEGEPVVLGQPPDDDWRATTRRWFRDHLLGRTHTAASAVRVVAPDGTVRESVVRTRVTFADVDDTTLDWYLDTGEPRGKAGGYAIQGAGGLFVECIDGSPTNVVGLPLRETRDLLQRAVPALFAVTPV